MSGHAGTHKVAQTSALPIMSLIFVVEASTPFPQTSTDLMCPLLHASECYPVILQPTE